MKEMKCYWCKNSMPVTKDEFAMCKTCYLKTLDGFTLIEHGEEVTDLKVNDNYLTGRFVVINRDIIKDIVINNKSTVKYTSVDNLGKSSKGVINTTFIQRQTMKKFFTLEVLQQQKAIIPYKFFKDFLGKPNKRTLRNV